MEKTHQAGMDYEFWAKKIFYFYGLLSLVAIGGQVVGLAVTTYYYADYTEEYIVLRMLWPTAFIVLLMLACWFLVEIVKIYSPYILFFVGTLLAVSMILGNPTLPGLQMVLLLAMAISLIYLDKSTLTISFLINFAALLTIYVFNEESRMAMTPYEYFSYIFILIGGFIVYLAVIERGTEMLSTLRSAAEKEEELMIQNRVMEQLSKMDALTGLDNHKTFQTQLDVLVQQAEHSDMQLHLAVIDIDNFKKINDSYGHSAGDAVLKRVAAVIREKADTGDIAARYGGEEFVVIFVNKNFDESLRTLENMRQSIAELEHPEIPGDRVTVSAGLQNYYKGLSKSDFFNKADAYLYAAKRNGKNQVRYNDSHARRS